jgi:pyruvate carboxylase
LTGRHADKDGPLLACRRERAATRGSARETRCPVPDSANSLVLVFSKVLVANRGEIAVRAFRAAYELGAKTVAVFPHEDRGSEHRLKADEAYEIGERGHPVRAYLDAGAIVGAALRSGAQAVYPGYGFLSESPALAQACAAAGI